MTRKNKIDFEQKIRSMRVWEYILAMVEGLRKPKVRINMRSYGYIDETARGYRVCFGCAATNTVAHLAGIRWTVNKVQGDMSWLGQAQAVGADADFVRGFESAINALRIGCTRPFSEDLEAMGLEGLPRVFQKYENLPELRNNYTEHQLREYEQFAYKVRDYVLEQEAQNGVNETQAKV